MHLRKCLLILILAFVVQSLPACADSLASYDFSEPEITGNEVNLPGLEQYGKLGEPQLPFKTAAFVVPRDEYFDGVEITPGARVSISSGFYIDPAQEQYPWNDSGLEPTPPNETIYQSQEPYPGRLYDFVSKQTLHGYEIVVLRLYPVHYIPKTGEIYYYTSFEVRLKTSTTPIKSLGKDSKGTFRNLQRDRDRVRSIVDNPEKIPEPGVSSMGIGPGSYEFVIITNESFVSAFEPLRDFKNNTQGITTRIYTLQDIYSNYTSGDNASRIRSFIKDAYSNWSTSYVLLGADDPMIPAVSMRTYSDPVYSYENIPADLYYGGLDGTWNNDNDSYYGEGDNTSDSNAGGTAGEEADFLAEVYIGRAPVDTWTEASNFVNKTLAYESNTTAGYLSNATMVGESLASYPNPVTWGGDYIDEIMEYIPQFTAKTLYQRDGTFSDTSVKNAINAGAYLINHMGHSHYYTVMGLDAGEIDALTNTEFPFIYAQGCLSNAFDEATSGPGESVSEHFIINPTGAFAYIGNTRYGWYSMGSTGGVGQQFHKRFYHVLTNESTTQIGAALQNSKEDLFGSVEAIGYYRWYYLTSNLLGDPTARLVLNLSTPVAHILTPDSYDVINATINITGMATKGYLQGAGFSNYTLQWGSGVSPSTWNTTGVTLENNGTLEAANGVLGSLDPSVWSSGTYTIRLTVNSPNASSSYSDVIVTVDSIYITLPKANYVYRAGDTLNITGRAIGTNFSNYTIEFGNGTSPSEWVLLYNSSTPVIDDTLYLWNTSNISEANQYTLRLTVNLGGGINRTANRTIILDPAIMEGWPKETDYGVIFPSAVADVNLDGYSEVIATESQGGSPTGRKAHLWYYNGSYAYSWPVLISGATTMTGPCVGNIDYSDTMESKKRLEILFGQSSNLKVLIYNGSDYLGGAGRSAGGSIQSIPTIANIQTAAYTDEREFIFGSNDNKVNAWHMGDFNFNDAGGWPTSATSSDVHSSAAVGDIDGDSDLEVVVANLNGDIYAIHHNGTNVSGWPKAVGGHVYSSPALGDFDGDGTLEIAVASDDGYLHLWYHNGTNVSGWPKSGMGDCHNSPIIADIDGDNEMDIILADAGTSDKVYAWHFNGSLVGGWPKYRKAASTPSTDLAPSVADLDMDGDIEVVLGSGLQTIVWDLNSTYNKSNIAWGAFQHDSKRTGYYSLGRTNITITYPSSNSSFSAAQNFTLNLTMSVISASAEDCNLTLNTSNGWIINLSSGGSLIHGPFNVSINGNITSYWNLTVLSGGSVDLRVESSCPEDVPDSEVILNVTSTAPPNQPPAFTSQVFDFTNNSGVITAPSNSTTPTNINQSVYFNATATDPESNSWRLLVCNSTSLSGLNCAEKTFCAGSMVSSGSPSGCSFALNSSYAAENYTWYAFACDGQNCSAYNDSFSPFHVNHRPDQNVAPVVNETSPKVTDSINCNPGNFTDPDSGDSENVSARRWKWYNSSNEITGASAQVLNISNVSYGLLKGNNLTCVMMTTDNHGLSQGIYNRSSNYALIGNSIPEVSLIAISPSPNAEDTQNLNCSAAASDPDHGDTLEYNFTWYRNNSIYSSTGYISSNWTALGSSNTTANEWWNCSVVVKDNENATDAAFSGNVTIQQAVIRNLTLVSNTTSESVAQNSSAIYLLNLTNEGNAPDNFSIMLINSGGADSALINGSGASLNISNLGPAETFQFNVSVLDGDLGAYNVTVRAASLTNASINSTVILTTTVEDRLNPSVALLQCLPNPAVFGTYVICNASVYDNINISSVSVNITYPKSAQILHQNATLSGIVNISSLNESGVYLVRYLVNDTSGNLNSTETTTFNVSYGTANVSVEASNQSPSYDLGFTVYTTIAAMNGDLLSCNATIYSSNESIFNTSESHTQALGNISNAHSITASWNFSTYNLLGSANVIAVVNCTSGGASNSSTTINVSDYTSPKVVLISPGGQLNTSSITFSYNVSDISSVSLCKFVLNGTVVSNDTSVARNTTQWFYRSGLSDGVYNWSINCTDNSTNANEGSSGAGNFTLAVNNSDKDYDGIDDEVDYLIGQNNTLNTTTLCNPKIYINSSGNLSMDFNGGYVINITENDATLVWFNWSFVNESRLNLLNVFIETQEEGADAGGIVLNGINTEKTVFVESLQGANSVCIKDSESATALSQITSGCTAVDETFVNCTGENVSGSGGAVYRCSLEGNKYVISGVLHSAVREQEYVPPEEELPENPSKGPGRSPGGGSGGGAAALPSENKSSVNETAGPANLSDKSLNMTDEGQAPPEEESPFNFTDSGSDNSSISLGDASAGESNAVQTIWVIAGALLVLVLGFECYIKFFRRKSRK